MHGVLIESNSNSQFKHLPEAFNPKRLIISKAIHHHNTSDLCHRNTKKKRQAQAVDVRFTKALDLCGWHYESEEVQVRLKRNRSHRCLISLTTCACVLSRSESLDCMQ